MIIRHNLPTKNYTKVDRRVFVNPKLTDGAKVLYGYLCGLRNGANFSDKYIVKAMGMSLRALANRKKELKENKLILIEQISPRVYVIYIGYTSLSAAEVRDTWIMEEDNH